MPATINDLIDDSFADLPRPQTCPAEEFAAPVLTLTVNDHAVLTIARCLHDGVCLHGSGCELRDFHAMDIHETDVRLMLATMVQASAESDSPEINLCRSASERRWFQGKWWCTACGGGIRFGAGTGWAHTR
jgi:hypothetical protein